MYNSLSVIFILKLLLCLEHAASSNPSHCLVHLRRHQPSVGHYLLRIEHSINNDRVCEQRCSTDHLCSMATFNRHLHRCHLFQNPPKYPTSHSYRWNSAYSTFTNCPGGFADSTFGLQQISDNRCIYDSLPWQQARTFRSIIFQSYTLIGISYIPCQALCSSVRHCAGVQYQVRGSERNRCRLLRTTKPWDLTPSRSWTVFAKRTCHVQVHPNDLFFQDQKPLCNFMYFGQGRHKHYQGIINTFPHVSETQCQYLCSKIVNCIGIEFVERQSQCVLLSPNFLRNDGLIDVKSHSHHHIYMKISCSTLQYTLPRTRLAKCSLHDSHCGCQSNTCGHGTCLTQRREGYDYLYCNCYQGFTGRSCTEQVSSFCPCLNGGICRNAHSDCLCSTGYSGAYCQIITSD